MSENLYWAFVKGTKELSDRLEDALYEMEHGDMKTAKKIINDVREDLIGHVIRREE